MKLTQPRMYGRNGRGMWKMPAPKPFEPEGITVGTEVTYYGSTLWQVWAKGPSPRTWWLANGSRYEMAFESDLRPVGRCADPDLWAESA